jgi:hypothetical protein
MRDRHFHLVAARITPMILAVSSLLAMAGTILAQNPGPPAGVGQPPITSPNLDDRQRTNREAGLRTSSVDVATEKAQQARIKAALSNVAEDYKRIQVIRNEMVDILVAGKPLNYELISNQTAEINTRANRLKLFLARVNDVDEQKNGKNSSELTNNDTREALIKLCNLIYAFTKSPVLRTPDASPEQSAKAKRDLASIVELSNAVKITADKLKKVP